ncbi:rod shape-determining protein MreD [Weissella confusa]|uniref:Rod shape-determining protein MreD n=1 Tax=Weissella confusa TaxID=1583 RepID=A0A923NGP4_WEICO|nr:rod shape-determining protein MreD [Weissella confusa]
MFPTLIINLMLLVLVYGLLNYWYHATRQPDIWMMPVLTGTVTQMKERSLYIAAFLGGLLFDIFYSGLIGISMIGFPLTVWLASKLQRYLPTSFMSSVEDNIVEATNNRSA